MHQAFNYLYNLHIKIFLKKKRKISKTYHKIVKIDNSSIINMSLKYRYKNYYKNNLNVSLVIIIFDLTINDVIKE